MYLRRKIDTFLQQWKEDSEKLPLIVRGARQVGKTEAIRHFAKKNYKRIIEINFVEKKQFKGITENGYNPDSIVKLITLLDPTLIFEPHNTLIFFDEIQEFPEIVTSLKFFKIDGRYDVICSGSLLGIHQKRIESNSVGYKTDFMMKSFDFEEFLWAIGYSESISEELLSHMLNNVPFSNLELEKYFSLFMDYVLLGGMPSVILRYVESKTFNYANKIQKQILLDYQEDIRKYAESLDKTKISSVFNSIAPQLAKENKKFQYSMLGKSARSREYFGCVEWLLDAGVISACYCLNYPDLPLKGNYDDSKFKLYMADTGLLIAMLDEEASEDLRRNKNLGVYKGALYENFVAEALVKSGYDLYYYRTDDSSIEEDFFVRTQEHLVPVEVKAGNTVSKSLRKLIESKFYPTISYGIKFAHANIGRSDTIITFPYFCAFLLKRFLQQKDLDL